MASSLPRLLCSSLALVSASACREGAEIEIGQTAESVVFTVVPVNASFDACIQSAYVYSLTAGVEKQIWDATRGMKTEPCLHSVAYSARPDGFSAGNTPTLQSGKSYRVGLLGPGFNETQDFVRQ